MTPKLQAGDIVIYQWTTDIKDRDVVICRDEFGDHVMKHYRIKNGEGWLVSDNSVYPKIKSNGLQIVGKVLKAIREVEL
jgi:SOS-response transcriptional repressor LexA